MPLVSYRILKQNFNKAETLDYSLVVISPQQSENHSQYITFENVFSELKGQQFQQSDAKVCEVICIHAEVNHRVQELSSEYDSQDVP